MLEEKRTKLKIDLDKLLLFKLFCFYDVTIRTMDVFHFVSPLIFPFINTLSSFMEILDFLYVSSCFMAYDVFMLLTTHDLGVLSISEFDKHISGKVGISEIAKFAPLPEFSIALNFLVRLLRSHFVLEEHF